MNNVIKQAQELKEDAKTSKVKAIRMKDTRKLDQALEELNEAIDLLKEEYNRIKNNKVEYAQYKNDLYQELADCYGMKGGIYRRKALLGHDRKYLVDSARMYKQGLKYEINDSYNLSNSVVIPILIDPTNLEEKRPKIQEGIKKIEEQVQGKRRDQWWAWADLGLFNVLMGNDEAAFKAYGHFTELGARAQDYESTLTVLSQLLDSLQTSESDTPTIKQVARSINNVMVFLKENKPGEVSLR